MFPNKANLFLIGAAKSGTTSLARALAAHPEINSLAIKEPGHFCSDIHAHPFTKSYQNLLNWDETQYFSKPPVERHMAFVQRAEHYKKLVAYAAESPEHPSTTAALSTPAEPKIAYILDASTAYLYSQDAPEKVYDYNPRAKILVILRNPIERAYSHYTMAMKYGMERRSPLQAFEEEAKLERALWGVDECYLELGHYAQQLKEWLTYFDRSQILVLLHEDLGKSVTQISQFLNISPLPNTFEQRENEGSVPKFPILNAALMKWAAPLREKLPKRTIQKLKSVLQRTPDPIDESAHVFLRNYFRPHILELEELLHLNLNNWK